MRLINISLSFLLALVLSGCFLNPYRSKSNCPQTDQGECISVQTAYDKSMESEGKRPRGKTLQEEAGGKRKPRGAASATSSEKTYRDALYARLTGLIREPVAPVIAPPRALRVLILPYNAEGGRLYGHRFITFFVDEPRFILDETGFDGREAYE